MSNPRLKRKWIRPLRQVKTEQSKKLNQIVRSINILSKSYQPPESKCVIGTNSTTAPGTGTIIPLAGIAQGDDYNMRSGDAIHIKACAIAFRTAAHASSTNPITRVIMFMDKHNAGSAPAVTDVLTATNVLSPTNHLNTDRFHIYRDKMYVIEPAFDDHKIDKWYVKIDARQEYDGTAYTDTQSNSLYLLFMGNDATYPPSFEYYFKTTYYDL